MVISTASCLIGNFGMLQVLLLDEVTVDLDVVARMDLLELLKEECDQVLSLSSHKLLLSLRPWQVTSSMIC